MCLSSILDILIQSYAMKIQFFFFHFYVYGLCQQNRNATLIFVVCSILYYFFSSLQRFILFTVGFSVYDSQFQGVCVCVCVSVVAFIIIGVRRTISDSLNFDFNSLSKYYYYYYSMFSTINSW